MLYTFARALRFDVMPEGGDDLNLLLVWLRPAGCGRAVMEV